MRLNLCPVYVPLPSAVSSPSACSDSPPAAPGPATPSRAARRSSSVTIEGKQGEEPKVTFDGRLDASPEEKDVPIEGDGETVADGDTVSANWWIGNGFTEEEATEHLHQGRHDPVDRAVARTCCPSCATP